jgi:hypothetical protein
MKEVKSGGTDDRPANFVYDQVTGRILARHSCFNVETKKFEECQPEEVLALYKDDERTLKQVTDGDVNNLSVLRSEMPKTGTLGTLRVSTQRQMLVSRPLLHLRTDRDELEGDGQDSLVIYIEVLDDEGRVIRDFAGEVEFTTTRGKLSARGGRVTIERGQSSITLTSVRETVNKVYVRARSIDDSAVPDRLTLSFE